MAKTYDYSKLPDEECWIIDQTLKTGNLNYFTNFYLRLPNSGTMWMPDDCLGNYSLAIGSPCRAPFLALSPMGFPWQLAVG